jgi:hypothetical protein
MPALILATGKGMHVKNRVDAFCSASLDDSIRQTETAFLDLEIFGVVHEVAMVDRHSDAIQSQRSQKFSIFSGEEVVKEAVEEVIVLLLTENSEQGRSHLVLVARVAGDEVLHAVILSIHMRSKLRVCSWGGAVLQMPTCRCAFECDPFAIAIYYFGAANT